MLDIANLKVHFTLRRTHIFAGALRWLQDSHENEHNSNASKRDLEGTSGQYTTERVGCRTWILGGSNRVFPFHIPDSAVGGASFGPVVVGRCAFILLMLNNLIGSVRSPIWMVWRGGGHGRATGDLPRLGLSALGLELRGILGRAARKGERR